MRAPRRGRSVLAVLAAAALTATACGTSDSNTSDASSDSAGSTYTIGVLNSTTGELGAVGQQEAKGMDLAVEEINAAGGVNGHQLKLETVDDQGSVNLATAGFKKLAADSKVPIVIGPGISATAKAVAPLADQYDVTQILLVAQPAVANGTKNVFEVPLPGTANAEAVVKYAASKGVKTASVIWANNPYGQAGNTDITAAAKGAGISIVNSEGFDPAKFDFTAQAGKVASANPEAVFLWGAGGAADALVLKAVRASGYKGKVIGDLTYSTSTIPEAAGEAADSVVSLTAVDYGAPEGETKKLIDAYKAKYANETPTVLSVYAYVAVKLAAAGIEKAGTFEGPAISAAIQSLNYESVVGTMEYTDTYRGGPTADAFKPVSFKNGEFAPPAE